MPRGPHLDDLIRQARAGLARVMLKSSGRGVRKSVVTGLLGVVAIAWGLSGIYEVGPDEAGMVIRFGAFVAETGPGVHYHLPAPIEAVRRLPIGSVNRLDLAAGGDDAGGLGSMATQDHQLAEVSFSVQWRITDPYKYLFQAGDPQAALRQDAAAAMRQAVGQTPFAEVVAAGHGGASARAAALLRASLRHDDLGVSASSLQIGDVEPPAGAQAGFHDMAEAREDARIASRDVGAYRDRVLAAAGGDAAKAAQASQGYRDLEVSEARGEAERFALVDAQYRKAPDVTRERLYTEMMERVLHNTRKVIVQTPKGFSGQIVLPPELFRARPTEQSASPAPSQGPAAPAPSTADAAAAGPTA